MRIFVALFLMLVALNAGRLAAAETCMTLHGRANFYGGDGQMRLWHIGTHHEYMPGDEATWNRMMGWLRDGVPVAERSQYAIPESTVYLFGDFVVCPSEPLRKGAVQRAVVKSVRRRHYVPVQ